MKVERKKRVRTLLGIILIFLICVLALTGCGKKEETIKIGMPTFITGPFASDGEDFIASLEMAIGEINANGGVLGKQLEYIAEDVGEGEPDKIIAAGEKLINVHKVDVVITGWTDAGSDIDEFGQYEVPYINCDVNWVCAKRMVDNMPEASNVFMTSGHDRYYAPVAIEFFLEELQEKGIEYPNNRVAFVYVEDLWANSIVETAIALFAEKGWEIVTEQNVLGTAVEWTNIIAQVKAQDPSIFYYVNIIPRSSATFIKQFRDNPVDSLLFSVYTPGIPEYLELTGPAANGSLWITTIGAIPSPQRDAFCKKFEDKVGRSPGYGQAPAVYDMPFIWKQAVEKVGDEKDYPAVCKAIETLTYDGLCGTYDFDPETHWAKVGQDKIPFHIYQIQDEKQVLVHPTGYGEFKMPEWINSDWR